MSYLKSNELLLPCQFRNVRDTQPAACGPRLSVHDLFLSTNFDNPKMRV
jgi:hypothetical protein